MCRERERGARRDAGPASGRDARTRHDVGARSARARPLRHQGLSDRRHQSPCLVCHTDRLSAGVASLSVPLDSAFGAFLLLGVIVASAQTRSVRLRTSQVGVLPRERSRTLWPWSGGEWPTWNCLHRRSSAATRSATRPSAAVSSSTASCRSADNCTAIRRRTCNR